MMTLKEKVPRLTRTVWRSFVR